MRTPEAREQNSKRKIEFWSDTANREAHSKRTIKSWNDPMKHDALSKRMTEFFSDPMNREAHSKRMTQSWNDPAKREAQSKRTTEFLSDPVNREANSKRKIKFFSKLENREKQSKIATELWESQEYRDKVLKANSTFPNKPEQILNQITPDDVRYTGNRSFWVRIKLLVNGEYITKSKNPDFKITGQKKVIELYGDYWHKSDDPETIINAYKEIGYECLVIWESEIYNELELTLERISQFMDKTQWQMTLL
jgi:hypothetical protein